MNWISRGQRWLYCKSLIQKEVVLYSILIFTELRSLEGHPSNETLCYSQPNTAQPLSAHDGSWLPRNSKLKKNSPWFGSSRYLDSVPMILRQPDSLSAIPQAQLNPISTSIYCIPLSLKGAHFLKSLVSEIRLSSNQWLLLSAVGLSVKKNTFYVGIIQMLLVYSI